MSRAWALLPLLALGCDDGVTMASGYEATMRVRDARWIEGALPAATVDGGGVAPDPDAGAPQPPPVVAVVQATNLTVRPGQRAKEFRGSVSYNATTVAIGLRGDRGYWLVPIDAPDVDLPPNLTFHATADFGTDLVPGTRELVFAGVDAQGRYGPARALPLTVVSGLPTAPLAVVLDWDRPVDLDLVVRLPDGTTLTHRGIRDASGAVRRANDGDARIDLNSNPGCVLDGVQQEAATFPAPTAGAYDVRVHMFAACGQPVTAWRVRVLRAGEVVREARGYSYAQELDAPGGGVNDDGRRALTFEIAP